MNVAEKLAREIRRVAQLRHHYEAIGANGTFALTMIDAALELGCKAAGVEDPVAQIAAGQQLEGIES
jgi:hypothetical protein